MNNWDTYFMTMANHVATRSYAGMARAGKYNVPVEVRHIEREEVAA